MNVKMDELERLASLHERGALSTSEFAAAKAAVLGGATSSGQALPPFGKADSGEAGNEELADPKGQVKNAAQARADAKGLWESFRPIRSINEAGQLLKAAMFAGVILFGEIVLEFGGALAMDGRGELIDPSIPNDEAIGLQFIGGSVMTVLIAAAVWGVLSKRSRVAAFGLVILCCLNFVGDLAFPGELEGTMRFGVFLLSATAIFLSVQAVRAVMAHRRFNAAT